MIDVDNIIDDVINNPDIVASLDENEIEQCLERVIPLFGKEKALVELKGNISFVGDTHGDFETTKSVVKRFLDAGHLVFLGDYIDREQIKWGSIYNVTYLLLLKCLYPEKIFLLKGNHECNYVIPCFPYEFEREVIQRYGSSRLHTKYVEVFSSMPLMVLANNIFASHGGILKGTNLEQLRKIGKNDLDAIESIVWSDPVVSPTFRGAGDPFNEEDLTKFLDGINASVFIRGHDYSALGFSVYGDRCLTIFSSRRYKEMGNGGILVARTEKGISSASDVIIEDFSTEEWMSYKVARR
ncbi:MAG: metallophosphoesterase [Thermoplasmatales archaeon]|nr:MAG: metallophosphoesterase [Thermoplasmatales archaeon]